jgi:hypothetical protein
MSFYFKRMIPAALRFASYGRGPDSLIGSTGNGERSAPRSAQPSYILFLVAFLWGVAKLHLCFLKKLQKRMKTG